MPVRKALLYDERPDRLGGNMERAKGIEPSYEHWQCPALPLSYARIMTLFSTVAEQSQDFLVTYFTVSELCV